MHMNSTLTVTRKGQTTLPIEIRQKLGIGPEGGSLRFSFDEKKKSLIVKKIPSLDELNAIARKYAKPGVKPVLNVDAYYQKYRGVE
jgi:bifunctional DNA-binding transcriptional regulator/antitoxin component of YhaV-PrlF toxin-antitoxin module